eukprot:gene11026-23034_t
MEEFKTKLDKISQNIRNSLSNSTNVTNSIRRNLYSDVELLRLDIMDKISKYSPTSSLESAIVEQIYNEMNELSSKLDLVPVERPPHWWDPIDIVFRATGVVMALISMGLFCALPMILVRPLDSYLVKKKLIQPMNQISEIMKRSIVHYTLKIAGVSTVLEGLNYKTFEESCVLLTFSHASNLDGYFVSSTCPVKHYALAKKELFLVPFFSWISFALGGIPVDRENRERAVLALDRSTKTADKENICIVIAPEGTRSKTGQLLPFKK